MVFDRRPSMIAVMYLRIRDIVQNWMRMACDLGYGECRVHTPPGGWHGLVNRSIVAQSVPLVVAATVGKALVSC